MTDFDRLKLAMEKERLAPRPAAREAAVAAALAAFDAKSQPSRQGSGVVSRLRNAARAATEIMTGQRPMTQISMRHALAGGVSLAVLTLAVMTAANLQTIENMRWRDAPEPVAAPPAKPAPATERRETVAASDALADALDEEKAKVAGRADAPAFSKDASGQRRSPLRSSRRRRKATRRQQRPSSPRRRRWPTLSQGRRPPPRDSPLRRTPRTKLA